MFGHALLIPLYVSGHLGVDLIMTPETKTQQPQSSTTTFRQENQESNEAAQAMRALRLVNAEVKVASFSFPTGNAVAPPDFHVHDFRIYVKYQGCPNPVFIGSVQAQASDNIELEQVGDYVKMQYIRTGRARKYSWPGNAGIAADGH